MLKELFHRLADGARPRNRLEAALQSLLSPAAAAYGAGARATRMMYDTGIRRRARLPVPVISIGNVSMGGTGKTPFTIWVTRMLIEQGRRPAVLSRGYGRGDEDQLVVVQDRKMVRAGVLEAGDEPVLIARALPGVPVLACSSRKRSGLLAVRRFQCDCAVLDDGFQHHALERAGDIVLIDATRPLSSMEVFPRGTLREPLAALKRADLLVLTRCEQVEDGGVRLQREIKQRFPGVPAVRTTIEITGARRVATGAELTAEELRGRSGVLACGVGNPDAVRRSAAAAGVTIHGMMTIGDHATLDAEELTRLELRRRRAGADFLLVTEKDAVKIESRADLPGSLVAIKAELRFATRQDEERTRAVVMARLGRRRSSAVAA